MVENQTDLEQSVYGVRSKQDVLEEEEVCLNRSRCGFFLSVLHVKLVFFLVLTEFGIIVN